MFLEGIPSLGDNMKPSTFLTLFILMYSSHLSATELLRCSGGGWNPSYDFGMTQNLGGEIYGEVIEKINGTFGTEERNHRK